MQGKRVLEGGCSAGASLLLPPAGASDLPLMISGVVLWTPAWAEGIDNWAVVALPFAAGYWPCACCIGLCLEPALMSQRQNQGQGGGAESGHCAAQCPGRGSSQGQLQYLHSPDQCQGVTQMSQGGHSSVACYMVGNCHGCSS